MLVPTRLSSEVVDESESSLDDDIASRLSQHHSVSVSVRVKHYGKGADTEPLRPGQAR